MTELPEGFGLVPLREARGVHRNHPRSMERRMARAEVASQAARFDPMAYQAVRILREVLAELRLD